MRVKFDGYIEIPTESIEQIKAVQPKAKEEIPNLGTNAGKLVFVEAVGVDSKGNPRSNYYDGEYICLRQTEGSLYVVKPAVGYGGHEIRAFHLLGSEKYRIVDAYENDEMVLEFIKGQQCFYDDYKNGCKKQWVDYVYTNALSASQQAQRALDFKNRNK